VTAFRAVERVFAVCNSVAVFRTDRGAFAACGTSFGTEEQFRFEGLRFRIVAPETVQRTALVNITVRMPGSGFAAAKPLFRHAGSSEPDSEFFAVFFDEK